MKGLVCVRDHNWLWRRQNATSGTTIFSVGTVLVPHLRLLDVII
jgi:hypothetical protein